MMRQQKPYTRRRDMLKDVARNELSPSGQLVRMRYIVHGIVKRNPNMFGKPDYLAVRAAQASYVLSLAQRGRICVHTRQRDCDHYWSEYVTLLPALPRVVEAFIDRMHENAEGPCYNTLLSPREGAAIRRELRGK